ncbi:hypothetical protein E4U13_007341 [Claviceps humidiphila]|uniref:Uncharacterized protein n=1 Tax=Claviceps humidiphila TaxID=1294629 RepID=A0A9P7TMK4_9HYPO|nr:hypothetical protein E4U13_007341 [Claviceps humidiphila]
MSKRYAAHAVSQIKEAEGIAAMADAYAKMATAFGGSAGLIRYMMIEKGTYCLEHGGAEAAAVVTRRAVNHDATAAMSNVYQMLPPLMTTIQEQTGITLLEWQFGRMNASMQAVPL